MRFVISMLHDTQYICLFLTNVKFVILSKFHNIMLICKLLINNCLYLQKTETFLIGKIIILSNN